MPNSQIELSNSPLLIASWKLITLQLTVELEAAQIKAYLMKWWLQIDEGMVERKQRNKINKNEEKAVMEKLKQQGVEVVFGGLGKEEEDGKAGVVWEGGQAVSKKKTNGPAREKKEGEREKEKKEDGPERKGKEDGLSYGPP